MPERLTNMPRLQIHRLNPGLTKSYTVLKTVCQRFKTYTISHAGGANRPLPRDGGAEKFRGDPIIGHIQNLDHR